MPYCVASDIRSIITTSISDDDILVYIGTADVLINDLLLNAGYSTARLKEIERYLTAHLMVATRDVASRATDKKLDDMEISITDYRGVLHEGFMSTLYGQQACSLDTTGTLRKTAKGNMLLSIMRSSKLNKDPSSSVFD